MPNDVPKPTLAGALESLDDASKGVPWGKITLLQYLVLLTRSFLGSDASAPSLQESANLQNPASNASAVTPHNTNALANTSRSLFVGTGGTTLTVTMLGGGDVVFANVPDGTVLPIRVTHVKASGTDASGIVNLF